jgi:hypothetical protein
VPSRSCSCSRARHARCNRPARCLRAPVGPSRRPLLCRRRPRHGIAGEPRLIGCAGVAGLCGAHFRCHSLTDCVSLAFASTTFCLVEFKFAVVDFALPAPLVWVIYAHVPFRKFYSALRISARFLKGHSAPGFASLASTSMSYRSDHQRKRSAQDQFYDAYHCEHLCVSNLVSPFTPCATSHCGRAAPDPLPSCSGPPRRGSHVR